MELDLAISAAQIRLETATAAWHAIHKKRKEQQPANSDEIHQEFKDAKKSLKTLLDDHKSKVFKQETLDHASNLKPTSEILIPTGISTSDNPIDIDSIADGTFQSMQTSTTMGSLADIMASTMSKLPLIPVNPTTSEPAAISHPKTVDTVNDENQAQETFPAREESVTPPTSKEDKASPHTIGLVDKEPAIDSVNKNLNPAIQESSINDANIDPALKALSVFPAGVNQGARPPHHTAHSEDIPPGATGLVRVDSGSGEAPSSNGEAPALNFLPRSTMFPIPVNLQKELDECTVESSSLLQRIHALEVELCAPAQRTMDEIRLKLRDIDSGYAAVQGVEKRVSEIQNIITEGERAFTANERRKYLLKRKQILDKQRDEGEVEFARLTVVDLPEYQRRRNALMAEMDAVKLELQQLSSKSKKVAKGTNIRSKFAKASRQARSTKSSRKDKVLDDSSSSSSEESFEDDDGEGSKTSKRKSSAYSDPLIGRKRTKAQRLMLEVVYSDELKEETDANVTGLQEFKVDEWDCEEDMKEEANWAAMTPIQRVEYCDDIIRSIARFEKTGNLQDFRPKYRRSLRHVQSLLPEKCFESRRVAVAIHMTSHGNLICRFHKRYPKIKYFDNGPGLYRVQGVPKQPVYRYRVEEPATPLREQGYMSCGCLIDDVLLEFYFWKTLTISSPLLSLQGLEEPMRGDVFVPRHRSFLIKVFKDQSLLTADDIYDPNRPRGLNKLEREVRLLDISIARLAKLWEEKTGIEMRIIFPQREAELERKRLEVAEAAAKQDGESSAMTE